MWWILAMLLDVKSNNGYAYSLHVIAKEIGRNVANYHLQPYELDHQLWPHFYKDKTEVDILAYWLQSINTGS